MTWLFEKLAPAGVFFPLFIALIAVGLLLRWQVRRRIGVERWDYRVASCERYLLAGMVLTMLFFSVLQIVLRNFLHTGLIWIEPLLRHFVLWLCFTGGVVAAGRLRHIHMDVFGHLLPEKPRLILTRLTTLAAAAICLVLARASWIYLGQEHEFGSTGFLEIPTWLLTSVIFVGFALMANRFIARAIAPDALLKAIEQEGQEG